MKDTEEEQFVALEAFFHASSPKHDAFSQTSGLDTVDAPTMLTTQAFATDNDNSDFKKEIYVAVGAMAVFMTGIFVSNSKLPWVLMFLLTSLRLIIAFWREGRPVLTIKEDHLLYWNQQVFFRDILFFTQTDCSINVLFRRIDGTQDMCITIDLMQFKKKTRVDLIRALRCALKNKPEKSVQEFIEIYVDKKQLDEDTW